jgi:succinyl-CoA synthetase alpha subunit
MTTEPERAPRSTAAGAIIWCGKSTAREKLAVMETWEIKLRRKPAELGKLLRSEAQ